MSLEDKKQKILTAAFHEESRLENEYQTKNQIVNKAIDLLEKEGFTINESLSTKNLYDQFGLMQLQNDKTQEVVILCYTLDKRSDISPSYIRASYEETGDPEPQFLVDYISAQMFGDQTKSKGTKIDPLKLGPQY